MGEKDDDDTDEEKRLLECRTAVERRDFLARHFTKDRARLRQMVALRLDPRLQGRLDPSDVLQEAFIEAARRFDEYIQARPMPIFLWVRRITTQKLADLHRQHLGAKARDARREASIHQGPHASSATLAAQIVDQSLAPSQKAARDEIVERVHDALESMNPMDREVLVLRHFEQLSNLETARALEIEPKAASKRHSRALGRMRRILKGLPDNPEPEKD